MSNIHLRLLFLLSVFTIHSHSLMANELQVFLATSFNAISQASAGTECPMAKFTTRVKTNRAGTLSITLSQQIGIGPVTKKQKKISSTLQTDGSFIGRYEEWVTVDKSSVVRVKAEEVDNPYILNDENLSTLWKKISLVCSGASGLTVNLPRGPDGSGNGSNTTNPNLPSNSGGIAMLPDHAGGGRKPSTLTGNGQQAQITKAPLNTGLRSDDELIQAKKPKQLLGHELSHTQQQGGVRHQQGRVLTDADWNEQKQTAGAIQSNQLPDLTSNLYVYTYTQQGSIYLLKASDAKSRRNGKCEYDMDYHLKNSGNINTDSTFNAVVKIDGAIVKQQNRLSLKAKENKTFRKTLIKLKQGMNELHVIVDSNNTVSESNETNNMIKRKIKVVGSCIELASTKQKKTLSKPLQKKSIREPLKSK